MKIIAPLLICAAAAFPSLSFADSVVGSWNVMRMGHGEKKDFSSLAKVASHFDILSVQEVMTEEGFEELRERLTQMTGMPWDGMVSAARGRGSYKEMYGFLWRSDRITSVENAVTYLDPGDLFEREPFAATFTDADGLRFVLTSVHSIYGKTEERREAEAAALGQYYAWLQENFPGIPVFMAGDFNLKPTNDAWRAMRGVARPALTKGASTLSSKNGKYANLYDNIWIPLSGSLFGVTVADAGIFAYPDYLGVSHEDARERVSDHAPVWVRIEAAR